MTETYDFLRWVLSDFWRICGFVVIAIPICTAVASIAVSIRAR